MVWRIPRNDPPIGPYDPHAIARFIRRYRTISTSSLFNAVRVRAAQRTLWLCPDCHKINREPDLEEKGRTCRYCRMGFTWSDIQLGRGHRMVRTKN